MTQPTDTVLIELERLRNALEVGITAIKGDLALLVQRTEQNDRRMNDLETRVSALEGSRWPLPAIATLTTVAALVTSVVALTVGR